MKELKEPKIKVKRGCNGKKKKFFEKKGDEEKRTWAKGGKGVLN